MSNNTGACLAHDNRVLGPGAFTAVTGTWPASRPLTHMATMQIPVPYVRVTPAAGVIVFDWQPQNAAGAAENATFDVIGLLAHTLPNDAVIEILSDTEQLAVQTWTEPDNASRNLFILLEEPVSRNELTISITSAGSDPIDIGALWVSQSFRKCAERAWDITPEDYSQIGQVEATVWPNRRTTADRVPGAFDFLTESEAIASPNCLRNIFKRHGSSRPVIWIPRAEDQAAINRTAIYGTLRSGASVQHKNGPWWRSDFVVSEMR